MPDHLFAADVGNLTIRVVSFVKGGAAGQIIQFPDFLSGRDDGGGTSSDIDGFFLARFHPLFPFGNADSCLIRTLLAGMNI